MAAPILASCSEGRPRTCLPVASTPAVWALSCPCSRGLARLAGCPRPWPGAMRFLVLVAACAGARRLDIVDGGGNNVNGSRVYASQGACLDATTGIVTCQAPSGTLPSGHQWGTLNKTECEMASNTWYERGHVHTDGCCLCDSNCDHSLETAAAGTCNYPDRNAGSCQNAATDLVTCDVTAGQCASPNVWSEAGALDSDGCCFCDETCDHSAETGTDCHLKGYADESESSGSCYDLFSGTVECDIGHRPARRTHTTSPRTCARSAPTRTLPRRLCARRRPARCAASSARRRPLLGSWRSSTCTA